MFLSGWRSAAPVPRPGDVHATDRDNDTVSVIDPTTDTVDGAHRNCPVLLIAKVLTAWFRH
jgi:DNA-binding beta-propeller fold protein YncE